MIKRRFLTQAARRVALGPALGLATLMMTSSAAWACDVSGYLGDVCVTAGTYCPPDTVEANGQILEIQKYTALYTLLGCQFGGDCRTTFAIPDLRGREMVHAGTGYGLSLIAVFGGNRGAETVTHTVKTMAPHSHTVAVTTEATGEGSLVVVPGTADSSAGTKAPEAGVTYSLGGIGGKAKGGPYTTQEESNSPATLTGISITLSDVAAEVGITGSGQPEVNIPPQLGLLVCVVTTGLYPTRP